MMKFIMIKLNSINYKVIVCLCISRKEFRSKKKTMEAVCPLLEIVCKVFLRIFDSLDILILV